MQQQQEEDGLRYRQRRGIKLTSDDDTASNYSLPSFNEKRKLIFTHDIKHLTFVILFFLIISIIVIICEKKLPEAKYLDSIYHNPGNFIAEHARNHLINLTSIGPRVSGSYENEILTVNYLNNTINNIVKDGNKNIKIDIDISRHSGAFPLEFLDGMTNVYRNVPNIVVKLGPKTKVQSSSNNSLLLNCHFDTFIDSPGASDNGAGCAVMLEILRVMSHTSSSSSPPLKHNIIFLFNGAEENLLQASHGFITQHKWAKQIKAFINIEACGAGGRELLFQAGPENSWIVDVYSKAVPYPYASSLAQEIFQSGIIPGDTDFRIFRDFGNVSGVDFAWSKNGYVYHTKLDTISQIPLGSLQRTGDNLLALTQAIGTSHYLGNQLFQQSNNSPVFFDFLGAFVVCWPQYIAQIVNLTSLFIQAYSIYLNINSSKKEIKGQVYFKQVFICIGIILISWILSMMTVTFSALILTRLGKVMSWYARPAWLFFLYVCPTISVSMICFLYSANRQKIVVKSSWILYQIYSDAYSIMWSFVLLICMIMEIRSAFISLHWVIFPAFGNIFKHHFISKWRDWKWLFYQVGILSIPYIQSFYLAIGALYLFIPIMGRSGASINSEVIIANMLSILFSLLLSFTMPIVILIKSAERIVSVITGLFLLSAAILILTPLGFPYSDDIIAPAPQRYMIVHTQRQYYDVKGRLEHSGTGFWIADLDMNSPMSLESIVPEIDVAVSTIKDCMEHLYCGLPYLLPVTSFLWKTTWIPGPTPFISIPTKLKVLSKTTDKDIVRLTFDVTGPDHIGIILSPYQQIHLTNWSIVEDIQLQAPSWNEREVYFIYYACASDCKPYEFSIDLKIPNNYRGTLLTVALAGHFMHGEYKQSKRFKKFVDQFPSWAVTTAWTASYSSWEIQ